MRILLDCDDVIADFRGLAIAEAERLFGVKCNPPPGVWDVFTMFEPSQSKALKEQSYKPGFCSKIKPFDGAVEFVSKLQTIGAVYIVTSPTQSPTWCYERTQWLHEYFGIYHRRVIFSGSKYVESGDVFIDDHAKHVVAWAIENPDGLPILFGTEGNIGREDELVDMDGNRIERIKRMSDYTQILDAVLSHYYNKVHNGS